MNCKQKNHWKETFPNTTLFTTNSILLLVDTVELGQVFLQVLQFPPVRTFPPVPQIHISLIQKKNKFLGKKRFLILLCSPQIPFYSMWIRLNWGRFFSKYFRFLLSVPFHQFSKFIFHSSFVDAIKSMLWTG